MSLRARLEDIQETVQELEDASEARYRESILLLDSEATRTAGVYLLGYSAEMLLKTAYFRFVGAASSDAVADLLGAAKAASKALQLGVDSENYHSVIFWAQLLVVSRHQEKRKLTQRMEKELLTRTEVLYRNWWIEMRYHALNATEQEARALREEVQWLRKHHKTLWR